MIIKKRKSQKKQTILFFILSALTLAMIFSVSCVSSMFGGRFSSEQGTDTEAGIEIFTVERGDVIQTVSATGSIESNDFLNLNLSVAGTVIKSLEAGDTFKKGDLLFEVDNEKKELQIQQAEASIKSAEISLANAQANYQAALDTNHINVQTAEISEKLAALSTQNTLTSIENANESLANAEASYNLSVLNAQLNLDKAIAGVDTAQSSYDLSVSNALTIYNNAKSSYDNLVASGTATQQELDAAYSQMSSALNSYNQALASTGVYDADIQRQQAQISYQQALITSQIDNAANSVETSESSYEQTLLNQANSYWQTLGSLENSEAQIKSAQRGISSAQIQLELAKISLELTKMDLEDSAFYAPFDGVVITSNYNKGESAGAGNVVSIISNDFVLKAAVDQSDIVKISEGNEVEFTLDSYPDDIFKGKIVKISEAPTVSGNLVSYEVSISLDELKDYKLFYGTTASLDIVAAKSENILYVPIQAVYKEKDRQYVDILTDMSATAENINQFIKKAEVTTGASNYSYIEILSGLNEGDVIITSDISSLKTGSNQSSSFIKDNTTDTTGNTSGNNQMQEPGE